jgi:hypothetical protein
LELARNWKKKVRIINPEFAVLINQVLARSPLKQVITETKDAKDQSNGGEIFLIVDNPENIELRVKEALIN